MPKMRRYAAHLVTLPDGLQLHQAIVELEESGRVARYYEFREEQSMTMWLGGEISLKYVEEGVLRAFWKNRPL